MEGEMAKDLILYPVGRVRQGDGETHIEIFDKFTAALSGLAQFSHIYVLYWFHKNDDLEKRATLKVHPRGNPKNPLTGVFATHSPVRPNLLALSVCKIISVRDGTIRVDGIDAHDGSPVIDIKGYFPNQLPEADIRLPDWA